MRRSRLPLLALFAALAASVSARAAAPEVKAIAPVKNFRLPTFTPEGYRRVMLKAGQARPSEDGARIDLLDMELTLFTSRADEAIEATLTAPSATFFPQKLLATGPDTVRLERADLTVTGADWSYDHPGRKVVILRDARLTFRSALGDILK